MLKSTPGVKSLLRERLQLQTQVEKLSRERSQKKQQQAAASFGGFAIGASSKVLRGHSNMLSRCDGYRNTDSERRKFQRDGAGRKKVGFGN